MCKTGTIGTKTLNLSPYDAVCTPRIILQWKSMRLQRLMLGSVGIGVPEQGLMSELHSASCYKTMRFVHNPMKFLVALVN